MARQPDLSKGSFSLALPRMVPRPRPAAPDVIWHITRANAAPRRRVPSTCRLFWKKKQLMMFGGSGRGGVLPLLRPKIFSISCSFLGIFAKPYAGAPCGRLTPLLWAILDPHLPNHKWELHQWIQDFQDGEGGVKS